MILLFFIEIFAKKVFDLMQQNSVKYVKIGYTIQRNLEENRDE